MSLWSYESQLLLILCAPLALLACDRRRLLAKPRITAAWYVLPAAYLFLSAYGYFIRAAGAYQEGVLRTDWSLPAVAQDLWFNLSASLAFWRWTENIPWTLAPEWPARFGMAAAAVYLLGWAGAALLRNARAGASPGAENEGEASGASGVPALTPTAWLAMLLASFAVLLMSFPAYLLLASAASLWRTQLLSGIGTALVWASLAGLAASLLPRRWPRAWVFLALAAVVANFGVASALRAGLSHDQVWSRQRQAFETMLKIAPRLPERTVVVAVNVPRASDPFGHNMWFNYGLKLVYPGSRIGGVYFYDDGAPAEGNHLHLESAEWVWDGSFEWPGYERQDASHTVVIDFDSLTDAQIDPLLPAILSPQKQALDRYNPLAVVGPGPPSPRAVRRYYPCPDWWWTLSPKPK
jgi:hypothetical protein